MNLWYVVPMWYISVHVCNGMLWPEVMLSATHNTSIVVEVVGLRVHLNLG